MDENSAEQAHFYNFSGFVLSRKGLYQARQLTFRAQMTGQAQKGDVETIRNGVKHMMANPNGILNLV